MLPNPQEALSNTFFMQCKSSADRPSEKFQQIGSVIGSFFRTVGDCRSVVHLELWEV